MTSQDCRIKDQVQKSKRKMKVKQNRSNPCVKQVIQAAILCDCIKNVSKLISFWWLALWLLSGLAVFTRMYNIQEPKWICWDETHFGKMAGWYINRTFFFDVHPPLGKMMLGGVGLLTGYNGSFPYDKPGDKYDAESTFIGMRTFCALLGSAIVPLCYCIVWELTASILSATAAALILVCDTGLLTLSQYILLDAPLLFFITGASMCQIKFHNDINRAFSYRWWFWLILTGLFLACAISVKFVGLFVVIFVGLATIQDLWILLGDLSLSIAYVTKHLLARAACLIALPIIVYMLFFAIHLKVLCKSGSGDSHFSSAFQSQLQGNALYDGNMPGDVAYGSVITVKNWRTGGVYLHSHSHLYPEGFGGTRQQQVTTYGHRDENNMWLVKPFDRNPNETEAVTFVKNGDLLRLQHVETGRNLHSHREVAPLTLRHYQVTCYGEKGEGDMNDVFRLVIDGVAGAGRLKAIQSVFRLVHEGTGCALHSHNRQLPKWGWQQLEVTCNPNVHDKMNLWNVEQITDHRLPNGNFQVYAPGYLEKFVESHAIMAKGNSDLTPSDDEVTSMPWQWPINYKGQSFSGGDYRVYLLGNPVIWWMNLVALAAFLCVALSVSVRRQRGSHISERDNRFVSSGFWLVCAWGLHYIPFWTMTRVLYFHHYFPAFLFNTMLTGMVLGYFTGSLSDGEGNASDCSVLRRSVFAATISVIVYSFWLFSPLSYGMTGPLADNRTSVMYGLRWLPSWEI